MMQDRAIVTKADEQESVPKLSNGAISNDTILRLSFLSSSSVSFSCCV